MSFITTGNAVSGRAAIQIQPKIVAATQVGHTASLSATALLQASAGNSSPGALRAQISAAHLTLTDSPFFFSIPPVVTLSSPYQQQITLVGQETRWTTNTMFSVSTQQAELLFSEISVRSKDIALWTVAFSDDPGVVTVSDGTLSLVLAVA